MADFQVTGNIRIPNAAAFLMRNQNDNSDFVALSSDSSANLLIGDANMPRITFATGPVVDFPTRIQLGATAPLQWSSDLQLHRDAADTLAQRRGLNAQTWYLYKTFTDASNYERLSIYGGGANPFFEIEPESAGSGQDNIDLKLSALGTNSFLELLQNDGTAHVLRFGQGILSVTPVGETAVVGALSYRNQLPISSGGSATLYQMSAALSPVLSSGSTHTFSNLIPAGAFLLGVTIRVFATITGPTSFDIGDGVDVDKWGAGIALSVATGTSIVDFTSTSVEMYPTAQDVIITANGGDFTAGQIRCAVHWIALVPPVA